MFRFSCEADLLFVSDRLFCFSNLALLSTKGPGSLEEAGASFSMSLSNCLLLLAFSVHDPCTLNETVLAMLVFVCEGRIFEAANGLESNTVSTDEESDAFRSECFLSASFRNEWLILKFCSCIFLASREATSCWRCCCFCCDCCGWEFLKAWVMQKINWKMSMDLVFPMLILI